MGDVTCMCILSAILQCLRPTAEGAVKRAGEAGFSFLESWLVNLLCFRRNMAVLDTGVRELALLNSGLVDTLGQQEVPGEIERTPRVAEWLGGVVALGSDVTQFRSTTSTHGCSTSRCCYCGCLCSSCELDELLRRVRDLKAQRETLGDVLVCRVPVVEIQGADPSTFTSQVEEILLHLANPEVTTVGIYGICGVGKTELLKAVNNHLFQKSREAEPHLPFDVDVVIHVDLKQEGRNQRDTIQTGIRRRLGPPSAAASSEDTLSQAISRKRCLLLLDHVWDALDWNWIGIPHPSSRLKVVFATLSKSVCDDAMKAQRSVRVDYLSDEASWLLFCRKMEEADGETWGRCGPYVQGLAKKVVVSMCGGLPGAIIAMARGLMNFTTAEAWEDIEKQLKHSPHLVGGMMDLFSTLKRSYDGLERGPLKMADCLLYCSLFPESRSISKEQLIDYWIGEGFLEEDDLAKRICIVRDIGNRVIDRLQKACLLERGNWDQREVKLHSVVRRMALWLTHGDTNKFLTSARLELSDVSRAENWKRAMRISLMDCHDKEVPEEMSQNCPELRTLLLNNHDADSYKGSSSRCTIYGVSDDLFNFFPALRVMDLSGTNMTSLPGSISSLVELRYLNLSHTDITSLPIELKELVKLRLLNLRNTTRLSMIPAEAISSFSNLQTLDLYCSSYVWSREERYHQVSGGDRSYQVRQAGLGDLMHVKNSLQELGINVKALPDLEGLVAGTVSTRFSKFASSNMFLKSTTFLSLDGVPGLTEKDIKLVFISMHMLLELSISGCPDLLMMRFRLGELEKLKVLNLRALPALSNIEAEPKHGNEYSLPHLHNLQIRECNMLEDLTCVKEFPYLQEILLTSCDRIQELVATPSEGAVTSLSELRKITLVELKLFSRFSGQTLHLPKIEQVMVSRSSNLKRLPLESSNLETMKEITGEQTWWDELEWYEGGRDQFCRRFTALNNRMRAQNLEGESGNR